MYTFFVTAGAFAMLSNHIFCVNFLGLLLELFSTLYHCNFCLYIFLTIYLYISKPWFLHGHYRPRGFCNLQQFGLKSGTLLFAMGNRGKDDDVVSFVPEQKQLYILGSILLDSILNFSISFVEELPMLASDFGDLWLGNYIITSVTPIHLIKSIVEVMWKLPCESWRATDITLLNWLKTYKWTSTMTTYELRAISKSSTGSWL
ncbi:hypothetical protein ACJX0J_009471 [Zea mays]